MKLLKHKERCSHFFSHYHMQLCSQCETPKEKWTTILPEKGTARRTIGMLRVQSKRCIIMKHSFLKDLESATDIQVKQKIAKHSKKLRTSHAIRRTRVFFWDKQDSIMGSRRSRTDMRLADRIVKHIPNFNRCH